MKVIEIKTANSSPKEGVKPQNVVADLGMFNIRDKSQPSDSFMKKRRKALILANFTSISAVGFAIYYFWRKKGRKI